LLVLVIVFVIVDVPVVVPASVPLPVLAVVAVVWSGPVVADVVAVCVPLMAVDVFVEALVAVPSPDAVGV